jgi:hypothetical protein
MGKRDEKLRAAAYWLRRAEETWELVDRFRDEAETFERFAKDAQAEADAEADADPEPE